MAVSFHVVVPLFLICALVDVVLLCTRTLLSYQRHSLITLYALMSVEMALLLLQLFAVVAQLLSTYLVTAGMWSHIASLFAAFFPSLVLRFFFTGFNTTYKNVLIPRWAAAAQTSGVDPHSSATRAWHTAGYGAVMVLDVACCCFYYLSAVYVLGYLSDKTLYVPYHRRRWRHLQWERATAATTEAALKARDVGPSYSFAPSQGKEEGDDATDMDAPQPRPNSSAQEARASPMAGTTALPRAPFAQWQECSQQQRVTPSSTGAPADSRRDNHTSNNTITSASTKRSDAAEMDKEGGPSFGTRPPYHRKSTAGTTRAGLPSYSSAASLSHAATAAAAKRNESTAFEMSARSNTTITTTDSQDTAHVKPTAMPSTAPPSRTNRIVNPTKSPPNVKSPQSHQSNLSSSAATSPLGQRPSSTSVLANLPPLQLPRRFTLNPDGEDGPLNQYAAALVQHGYSTGLPERGAAASAPVAATATAATVPVHHTRLNTGDKEKPTGGKNSREMGTTSIDSTSGRAGAGSSRSSGAAAPPLVAGTVAPEKRQLTGDSLRKDRGSFSAFPPSQPESSDRDAGTREPRELLPPSLSSVRRVLSALGGPKASTSSNYDIQSSPLSRTRTSDVLDAPQHPKSAMRSLPHRSTTSTSPARGGRGRDDRQPSFSLDSQRDIPTTQPPQRPSTFALPPRPPASFRIDQSTGDVVAVDP